MRDLKKVFLATIQEYNLLKKREKILVGCSGGQDSVTLLLLLTSIKEEFNLKIFVCHLNHMLRKESDTEEKFVSDLSKKLNLPFFFKKVNVKDFHASDSLEQTARLVRYSFFKELSKKLGIKKIALGHTKDDLIETLLMRVLRGAGLMGLRGFQPLSEIEGIKVIRPLIKINREETALFLKNINHPYCIDYSNLDTKFLRNKVRLKLLPFLIKHFGYSIREHLFNLSTLSWQDYDFIEKKARIVFKKISHSTNEEVSIDLEKFRKLHPTLQTYIFRMGYEKVKGNLRKFTFLHWQEVKNILKKTSYKTVYLPDKVLIVKTPNKLLIKKVDLKK